MSHERVEYTFQTNLISMFHLTRLAIPFMGKGSSIINVGSIQAYKHIFKYNLVLNHQLKLLIMQQQKLILWDLLKVISIQLNK